MLGKATVLVIEPDGKSLVMGCKVCKRTIASTKDKFMVGLIIEEDGQGFRYFLGVDPPITCCGEEKVIIKTFETDTEAETEKARVIQHLDEHGSTEGLKLISFSHFGMN
jgi:hypothetical protein